MTTREQVIHELSKRYPYPWRVGWWVNDERCGVEVSLHRGPRDNVRHFWAGNTWAEVGAQAFREAA
jgi:hypothetical protein